jgi:dolichol-phosphate mannosyltransferase
MSNNTLIIIPTYNENDNLPKIVKEISKYVEADILVVDDNSPDGTGETARQLSEKNSNIHVLHREKKEGLGRAYIAGFRWALAHPNKYRYIFEMDCDFSHDPSKLPKLLENAKDYDLVIGSRYKHGVSCLNWPFSRILLSKFANIYVKLWARLPIEDATGGYKCYRREVLENIDIDTIKTNGYGFQVETTYRAYKKGYRIVEVPIVFVERNEGNSKMSKAVIIEALFLVFRIGVGLYRFKPTKRYE